MARSRASARAAGSRFEREQADYFGEHVDDRIDRRVKTGAKDKGDLANVRFMKVGDRGFFDATGRITVEAKDCARPSLAVWMAEAEAERLNDTDRSGNPADVALVIHKRHGVGDPGKQWVTTTVENIVCLITGSRPADD